VSDENHRQDKEDDETSPPVSAATFREQLLPAALGALLLTVLCGIFFPLVLGTAARSLFPKQANGTLVKSDSVIIGSELIGQDFIGPGYFYPRPSAAGLGYDAANSGGTNLGPNNAKLWDGADSFTGIRQLASDYRRTNSLSPDDVIPADAVTRSGSGLDPHISPANAALQTSRVARARRLSEDTVHRLVAEHTEGRQFGFLGEPRVSVLALNRALDRGDQPPASRAVAENATRSMECFVFIVIVIFFAYPVSSFILWVFGFESTHLASVRRPIENVVFRIVQIHPEKEMSAQVYTFSFIAFTGLGTVLLFLLLAVQTALPGGPDSHYLTTPMTLDLALNTAISFSTTTTWQAYSGETTLRYLIQIVGLAAQNFLGGAAGLAVGIAFMRGFCRTKSLTVGNFWVDLIRALLWVLLPLAFLIGLVLVWQGVPLNLSAYTEAHTVNRQLQTIAQGPVAILEAIKNLGTNGGGFFNANGAHPYANPTPLTNFLGILAIAVIPASMPVAFGRLAKRPGAGWMLLAVMIILFTAGLVVCDGAESSGSSLLTELKVVGGNMEGKEVRFGIHGSVLAALVTSNGATGSYNSMHGSYHPVSVLVLLGNMMMGEVVFGGLGTGLYSIVMTALVGVFIAGLMIGRTPEYLGKTVTTDEAKLIALYNLLTPTVVLSLTALAISTQSGRAALVTNGGSRGFTEILFAFASCMANNGQNMAGLNANSLFYNITTAITMLAGRLALAALALALAGRLAAQRRRPQMIAGALPSDTITFGILVLITVIIMGTMSFLPALALGPIVEHLIH